MRKLAAPTCAQVVSRVKFVATWNFLSPHIVQPGGGLCRELFSKLSLKIRLSSAAAAEKEMISSRDQTKYLALAARCDSGFSDGSKAVAVIESSNSCSR